MLYVAMLTLAFAADPQDPADEAPEHSRNEWRGEKLPEGTVNYFGKKRKLSQFVKACREVTAKRMAAGAYDDRAVKLLGTIAHLSRTGGSWVVADKDGGQVVVVFDELSRPEKLKPGHVVTVYGIAKHTPLEDESNLRCVTAWHVALEPPGVRYQVALQPPGMIVAGANQTFTVNCVARNTGRQTLKDVTLAVRLAQIDSPNDRIETYTIRELRPGQTARFQIDFDFFNFQFIGKTSLPQIVGHDIVYYEL